MKQLIKTTNFKTFVTLLIFSFIQTFVLAQDSSGGSSSTTVTTHSQTETTTMWYSQPWVWVVGGIVLILVLAALLRGNKGNTSSGRTDQVTVTKTTNRDTDAV